MLAEDHLFIFLNEKKFHEYILDQKEFNATIFNPTHHQIFIYGFPCDDAKQESERTGVDQGPISFRKGLKDFVFSPFEKIDRIKIYDFGDVFHNLLFENSWLESYKIAFHRIKEFLNNNYNSTLFFVGGTNDITFINVQSYYEVFPLKKLGIININAHLEVENPKKSKLCSNSIFKIITEEKNFLDTGSILEHFAVQGAQNTQSAFDFIKKNKNKCFWLEKNIRKFEKTNHDFLNTQAGQLFEKNLQELCNKVDNLIISFDLDCIHSCFCPGVSTPSVIGGLSDVEALELVYLSGKCQKTISFNLIGYNPAVENLKTRKLVSLLFYEFCRGISERSNQLI